MFTGIVETTGTVISLEKEGANLTIGIESLIAKELKPGQSVAHNGVCLTVEGLIPNPSPKEKGAKSYFVTAVKETLIKTNLGVLKKGDKVNLERSLKISDRLDGHFVQGHVDTNAKVKSIKKEKGSWIFKFQVQDQKGKVKNLIMNKGSICINGVSLTVVQVSPDSPSRSALAEQEGGDLEGVSFSVAIIPHTFKHTNFSTLKKGDSVNIEFDILGKHIEKILSGRFK